MSENKHTPEPIESCGTCKNNGGTRGECQNESCAYEPKTKPLEAELAELRKQRDELLAALEKAREEMSCANFNSAAERIDHAIAGMKGGE